MPHSVKHITKIIDVSEVQFRGVLEEGDYETWVVSYITDPQGPIKKDVLDDWLEKFKGHRVHITITKLGIGCDDTSMLEGT
jgi:hypothetical protein